jgi:hypothetical protein
MKARERVGFCRDSWLACGEDALEGGAMALRGHRRVDGLVALHGGGGLGLLHRGGAEGEGPADGGIVLVGVHQHSSQRRVVLEVGRPAQAVLPPLVLHERLRAFHQWRREASVATMNIILHVYTRETRTHARTRKLERAGACSPVRPGA